MNYIKIYADFLKKFLKPVRPLSVVFDCSNGTTGLVLKKLLRTNSPINHKLINQIPDGNFPAHGPDPLKKSAISDLRSTVLKRKADLGVIFDADGDRVFFADNKGRFVDPDIIARLLIWQLKPKKIIIDVRAGWLVKKLKTENLKLKTSNVGHYFMKKMMRETKSDFGAESSGHYYFPLKTGKDICYADFGILAAIHVINAVSGLLYTLADFVDLSPQYYRSGEINIRIKNQELRIKNRELFKKIEKQLKTYCSRLRRGFGGQAKLITRISHLDGLTIETERFWFNIRSSNTESVVRLNIEAENKKILEKEKNKLTKIIRSAIN